MEILLKYFPELTNTQRVQFKNLEALYQDWNEKINVLSRKDMDHFYERHVLHSLSIAKFTHFRNNTKILDVGTGGGFPGIPLAIYFPNCQFTLADSIGKKIKVVSEVAKALNLSNVSAIQTRVENHSRKYHFVVSRAVTAMPTFVPWVKKSFLKDSNGPTKNGIISLKGGDLEEELRIFKGKYSAINLSKYFEEEFFETKKIVYLPSH